MTDRPPAGYPESMEQIVAAHYEDIYRFCYWKTRNREEAQDIAQDTFIRFMDAAKAGSDIEKPKALLYTIAGRLCLNWLKKPQPVPLDEQKHDSGPQDDGFADISIQKLDLAQAISTLPEAQQEVLLLRYGQDLKVGEIAEILGLSRFQAMYRIRQGLERLRKIMGKER